MNILKATHLGMCFGVRDAIELARAHGRLAPLTILGELVHNPVVIQSLQKEGIHMVNELKDVSTPTVMITAHGASHRQIAETREAGYHVIEATCPLVHHAHRQLYKLVESGFHPVVIGIRNHVEVRGMTGDLTECSIIQSEEDIPSLPYRNRYGVVAQTTQPLDRVKRLIAIMKWHFPKSEIEFRDTVCRPTKERQEAAIALAQQCDLVIVVGGKNSNNTRELVSTCGRHCSHVKHIQTASDINPDWLTGVKTLGLTAGTSTPDETITEVENYIRFLAGTQERDAGGNITNPPSVSLPRPVTEVTFLPSPPPALSPNSALQRTKKKVA